MAPSVPQSTAIATRSKSAVNQEWPSTHGRATQRTVLGHLVPRQATFARIEISRSTGWLVWRLRQAI